MSLDHINALFDALKKIEVDVDILLANFVSKLETELVCNMLSFNDNELPSEDVIEKNLYLYVCVNIDGTLINKALLVIGSNVNMFSSNLLQKYFPYIYANMKRTTISIKGFDNTQ